jgi:hypothetical protein
MPFVLTFPWRRFVLAMRTRHRTYQNEITIFVFGVTAKNTFHGFLPGRCAHKILLAQSFDVKGVKALFDIWEQGL